MDHDDGQGKEEIYVYRALTKERSASDKSFRLRPGESALSIATTAEKAMGKLDCKGYAKLSLAAIKQINGIEVRVKQEGQLDLSNPDTDLLEIIGLPPFDGIPKEIQDYANALVKTVRECKEVSKRRAQSQCQTPPVQNSN